MIKKKMKVNISVILATCFLVACGTNMEEELQGAWYREGSSKSAFTLYSDGSCEIAGEYGTGTWSIVNDNQLKLTNYYGESQVTGIISVEDGCLTLGDGDDYTMLYNEAFEE